MQKRFSRPFGCALAMVSLSLLLVTPAFSVDKGPLDAGTRLLVQEQPIIQMTDAGFLRIAVNEVDEDLAMVSGYGFDRIIESSVTGQAAVMGGRITTEEDGTVKDDRFLFSAQAHHSDSYNLADGDRLAFQRVDGQSGNDSPTDYPVDIHAELPRPFVATNVTSGTVFMDVAASDWNGDGYPDFAVLYPERYYGTTTNTFTYILVIVDGKPDENGHFTCYHGSWWNWKLQDHDSGGLAQGRIAAGDVDDDGRAEIVLHLGNQRRDGHNDRNSLLVYDVTQDLQLSGGITATAGESRENWDALDVAVGDFRGTGYDQIATLGSDKCKIWARIWEVKGGSLRKSADLGNVGKLPENKHANGYLRCVAGDLDGNGRDELVWAAEDPDFVGGGVYLRVYNNLDTSGGLNFSRFLFPHPMQSDPGHPVFDLGLGYFSEGAIPSDTTYPDKRQIALAARRGGEVHSRLFLWDESGFIREGEMKIVPAEWKDSYRYSDGYANASYGRYQYPVVAAGDMTKETLALGDPLHYEVAQQLSPVVVMQGTPRHWDRIGSQDYDAFSAFSGYKTSFSLQNTSTETTETSSQSSISMTRKLPLGGFALFGVVGTKLLTPFTHSEKKVEENLSRYTQTSTMKLTADAATDDWLYYTFQDLEIWRYPILGQAGEVVSDDVTTENLYYQVVYPTHFTTKMSGGRDKEWYAPVHENLNLLSYPNDVEYIADYPAPGSDRILFGGPEGRLAVTVGAEVSGTRSNTFTSATFGQEKDSHQITNGVDNAQSVLGKLFGKVVGEKIAGAPSGKRDSAFTETSTNSVNLSNALGFTTAVPEGSGYVFKDGRTAGSVMFDLYETAFLTQGKRTLVAGYAVDLLGRGGGSLWTDVRTSPYQQLADPALNLPQKWELQTVTNSYGVKKTQWTLCESETTRKKLRGGFAVQPDSEGSYDDSVPQLILVADNPGEIRLQCRVHNYSFVGSGPVDIRFSYIRSESGLPTEGDSVEIGTITLDGIPAWTRTGMPNWKMAEVDWDTSGLDQEGCYWIHVEVDPDDRIIEIHDTDDEAGNNEGWYQVGLVKEETLDRLAEKYLDGNVRTASVIGEPEADLEDEDLSMDNFDAGEGDTTLLRGKVVNCGDEPMALVHVDFFERVDGEWKLFDEEIIPVLMPGRTCTLEVPFKPSSSMSDVRVVIDPHLGEADFENNSIEITRDFGEGGCSVAPFPAMVLVLPLLLLLKR